MNIRSKLRIIMIASLGYRTRKPAADLRAERILITGLALFGIRRWRHDYRISHASFLVLLRENVACEDNRDDAASHGQRGGNRLRMVEHSPDTHPDEEQHVKPVPQQPERFEV